MLPELRGVLWMIITTKEVLDLFLNIFRSGRPVRETSEGVWSHWGGHTTAREPRSRSRGGRAAETQSPSCPVSPVSRRARARPVSASTGSGRGAGAHRGVAAPLPLPPAGGKGSPGRRHRKTVFRPPLGPEPVSRSRISLRSSLLCQQNLLTCASLPARLRISHRVNSKIMRRYIARRCVEAHWVFRESGRWRGPSLTVSSRSRHAAVTGERKRVFRAESLSLHCRRSIRHT